MVKNAIRLALFCGLAALPILAQVSPDAPVDVLRHPGWEKTVFIGGGTTVDSSPAGQNLVLGSRFGYVLTEEHGGGILRGTFEIGFDVIPLDEYWINGGQYAGGVDPIMWKWNFTSGDRIAPYFAVVGGALFSTHDLPPPNTAQVNFTSGPEIGTQIFRKGSRNSWDLMLKAYHLSNASIGNHNPGLNANIQVMVGYTWH